MSTTTISTETSESVDEPQDRSLRRHVGRVLFDARAGRSRYKIVADLGWTSPVNLLRMETGEDNPTVDRLERVAAALGGHLEVRFVRDDAGRA